MKATYTITFALLMASLMNVPAFGAQMEAVIKEDSQTIKPTFEYFRIIYIDYPNGGEIAESLRGEHSVFSFSAEYPETKGTKILLEKLNEYLRSKQSTSVVTDVSLEYKAELVGKQSSASIQYNIRMIPTISEVVVPRYSAQPLDGGSNLPRLVDSTWRGLSVSGPVVIHTAEHDPIDLNNPSAALQVMMDSQTYDKISETAAMNILTQDIIQADRIYETPLEKWHSLFDPTPLQSTTKKMGFKGGDVVLTRYSLGECNLETGPCKDILQRRNFVIDGVPYTIRSIESQDDATITIEGYVSTTDIAGLKVFGISKEQPKDRGNPATGGFPVTIIYGMAGIAVIGAGTVFFISARKLKNDEGKGQRGIDPSKLRAQETSQSSGSYKTNRGESHIALDDNHSKKSPV